MNKKTLAVVFILLVVAVKSFSLYTKYTRTASEAPRERVQTTDYITDNASLFTPEQQTALAAYHQKLLEVYDIDSRIVTAPNAGDINIFTHKTFKDSQTGSRSKTGRGLLLVIDPAQNLLRLETSKGLEGVYTDAFISYIEHRQMIPFFKAGRVADGILATTELVFDRAADAVAGEAFDPAKLEGSTGGGATNTANIGAGMEEKSKTPLSSRSSSDTQAPDAIVAAYLQAMQERNSNPALPIYSAETQAMMQKWVVTAGQMDMVVFPMLFFL